MAAAKYYIYRNLHTGGFSVRYRGKVIDRPFTFTAHGVTLKINEVGRQRAIKERQKNVHAFVVADKYKVEKYPKLSFDDVDTLDRVTYNPYKDTHFMCNGLRIENAKELAFQNGRCFLIE